MTGGPQRIGVFGGAFDPPHNAHVSLVQSALSQLSLDELVVCPTGQAWHKARTLSPGADRLAMTQLAFAHCAGITVDPRELRRPGPTYTIDTLNELHAERPGAELFLILGGDQAAALPNWHRWRDILKIAIISVALRDPLTPGSAISSSETLFPDLPGGRFQALQMPPMSLSATEVRRRAAAGLRIDHLVPAGVARYIEHHHLYLVP